MRALPAAELLTLWERGERLHPVDRALLVIEASDDGATAIADWPLGRRNDALARIRRLYFGPRLEGWTSCPACGETLEFTLDCDGLIATSNAAIDDPDYGRPVVVAGRAYRLPTSRDLAAIAGEREVDDAADALLRRCLVDADVPVPDRANGSDADDDANVDAVARRLAAADPLADVSLDIECPACDHRADESLDLVAFLWSEIEARARQLLADVHALATAYGWAESAILALSDARRATYVRLVST